MAQLPCAGTAEDEKLDEGPPHNSAVGGLGLVAELGFAFLFSLVSPVLILPSTPRSPGTRAGAAANVVASPASPASLADHSPSETPAPS